jgi:hypothetical protein
MREGDQEVTGGSSSACGCVDESTGSEFFGFTGSRKVSKCFDRGEKEDQGVASAAECPAVLVLQRLQLSVHPDLLARG